MTVVLALQGGNPNRDLPDRCRVGPSDSSQKVLGLAAVWSLAVLAFGCAQPGQTTNQSGEPMLSFPNRLQPKEQVVEFQVTVTNGKIVALNKAPVDWMIEIKGGWWASTIKGTPGHGASAFQDMAPLQRFLTVHKDRSEFDVTGTLVVTTRWQNMKTNSFQKSDFILEQITP